MGSSLSISRSTLWERHRFSFSRPILSTTIPPWDVGTLNVGKNKLLGRSVFIDKCNFDLRLAKAAFKRPRGWGRGETPRFWVGLTCGLKKDAACGEYISRVCWQLRDPILGHWFGHSIVVRPKQ